MARILLASWMVRYPLGGNLSWALQWLLGFRRLGHDVYLVERSGYAGSCFDPVDNVMTDDCTRGVAIVSDLLERHGLGGRWCYLDAHGTYHGLARRAVDDLFASADLFIDMGGHGSWRQEAAAPSTSVLIEAEPGFTQMKMENRIAAGVTLDEYDYYYSIGQNIGTPLTTAPTAGRAWKTVFNPVVPELFDQTQPPVGAAFTTVMNWRAHEPVEWAGQRFGQKDAEFERFIDLPNLTPHTLELAVSGRDVPRERLLAHGWKLRDAHTTTTGIEGYLAYISGSAGEFSVAKNVFVATRSGWFSDRSAAYLAAARPVVLQETGFSAHLPCGEGLFAVKTVDEAAAALAEIQGNYARHSAAAGEIAREYIAAERVLGRFLTELGL